MISEALRAHWSTLAVALAGCLSPSQVDFADPGLGTWVELRLARGRVSYAQTTTTTPTANRTQREGEGTIWVGFAEAPGELGLPQKPSELDPLPSDQEGARLPTERVKVVAGGQVEDGRWRPFDAAEALSVVTQFRFKPQMIECQELAQTPIQRVRLEAFAPAGIGNVSVMAALRDGRLLVGLDANRYFTVSGTIAVPSRPWPRYKPTPPSWTTTAWFGWAGRAAGYGASTQRPANSTWSPPAPSGSSRSIAWWAAAEGSRSCGPPPGSTGPKGSW